MTKDTYCYFNDDGTEINPDMISKPSLCASYKPTRRMATQREKLFAH